MSRVYIVNRSAHDFSAADKYGEVIFLSEGPMNRYSVNNMHRQFTDRMKDSNPDDYIVPCSLNVMNSVASSILAFKHGKLNILLFKEGNYIERNIVFEKDICEFYPKMKDDPVCACGSNISGKFICTREYSKSCQWAIKRRIEERR